MSTVCEESEFKITFSFYARKVTVNQARVSTYAVRYEDHSGRPCSRFQRTELDVLHRQLRIQRGHLPYLLAWSKIASLGRAIAQAVSR
jgi:hypothetical protein